MCVGVFCVWQAFNRSRGGRAEKKAQKFELTEEQKQEIREAFDLFDTDGSGMRAGVTPVRVCVCVCVCVRC